MTAPDPDSATSRLTKLVGEVLPLEKLEDFSTVVAISGGPDSVALAHFLGRRTKSNAIYLAHFNHRLRGLESDKDEQFVREFSQKHDCELLVGHSDMSRDEQIQISNRGEGLEGLARNFRYRFLRDAAAKVGARMVVTAHTLDDQVETIVHRFFRGSGVRGLVGIQPIREWTTGISLARPFLRCEKKLLLQYLQEHELDYRLDQSNSSDEFTRNRIRNELLPLARDVFENEPASAISSLADHLGEVLELIDPQVDDLLANHVTMLNGQAGVQLNQKLVDQPNLLLCELWIRIWTVMDWPRQQMNRQKWTSITEIIRSPADRKVNLPGNILADKVGGNLTIWAVEDAQSIH